MRRTRKHSNAHHETVKSADGQGRNLQLEDLCWSERVQEEAEGNSARWKYQTIESLVNGVEQ